LPAQPQRSVFVLHVPGALQSPSSLQQPAVVVAVSVQTPRTQVAAFWHVVGVIALQSLAILHAHVLRPLTAKLHVWFDVLHFGV
jgi:hypothetical protein